MSALLRTRFAMADENFFDVFCQYVDEYWVSPRDASPAKPGERLRLVLGPGGAAIRTVDEDLAAASGQTLGARVADAGHALVGYVVSPGDWKQRHGLA